jgi:hypothetical protein
MNQWGDEARVASEKGISQLQWRERHLGKQMSDLITEENYDPSKPYDCCWVEMYGDDQLDGLLRANALSTDVRTPPGNYKTRQIDSLLK